MPFSNYIYEYFDGISSGNITVGKWVRLLYEYIVKGLQEGLFTFNAKKANKAIRFIENFCHHCEGRTDLLKLELWQKAAVSVMFGIVEEDGTRVFREVFIVIGRKNGKADERFATKAVIVIAITTAAFIVAQYVSFLITRQEQTVLIEWYFRAVVIECGAMMMKRLAEVIVGRIKKKEKIDITESEDTNNDY